MRILLVNDDLDYINGYIAEIEKDYVVDVAYTAGEGAYMSEVNDYDVIVVDCNLPDQGGISLCKEVREANIHSPILFLADYEDRSTRISCLRDGANVCFPKDASSEELVEQIKAILKLRHRYNGSSKIVIGDLTVDLVLQEVYTLRGKIQLRKKEFALLEYLLLNKGKIVSKEELLDHIWLDGILVKSNSLEVHIKNLRTKLDVVQGRSVIKTVRGFGYKIE
jgi:DNA-binding response OmpR family regulator